MWLSIICATLDPILSWHVSANEILMLSGYFSALVLILSKNCINFHTGIGQCAIFDEADKQYTLANVYVILQSNILRQCKIQKQIDKKKLKFWGVYLTRAPEFRLIIVFYEKVQFYRLIDMIK